jgi:hypothetical protein
MNVFSQHFMLEDLLGGALAFLIFPLFTVLPGYSAAAFFDLLSFQQRNRYDRLAISITVSLGCFPILFYLAGHFGSIAGMWVFAGFIWTSALVLAVRNESAKSLAKIVRPFLAACGMGLFFLISLSDLQWGRNLLSSATELDYVKHVAVTAALFRSGADGVNPFFRPMHDIGLFYYQFWHLICSLVEHVGSPLITARDAVLGSLAWPALGLLSIIRLYVGLFEPKAPRGAYRTAFLLLLISGLDILPVSLYNLRFLLTHKGGQGGFHFDVEWWNVQATSWLGSMYWVPQHVASLVANLTGILLLRSNPERGRARNISIVLAGLCFATGFGASVWVTLAVALGIAVWIVVCWWEHRRLEAFAFLGSGAVAAIAAAPYLLHLRAVAQVHKSPVALSVRQFGPLVGLTLGKSPAIKNAVSLLALPLNYFLEFGLYAVAAFLWLRHVRRIGWTVNDKLVAAFAAASLVLASFGRSLMGSNDLGFRGVLPAQFFLLTCTVRVLCLGRTDTPFRLTRYSPVVSRALLACAVLGLATTVWGWCGNRLHHVIAPDTYQQAPAYRFEAREAYEFLQTKLPAGAITQHNPDRKVNLPFGLYGERQVVAADWFHGPLFSIDPRSYADTEKAIAPIFQPGSLIRQIEDIASRYSIAALIVDSSDPVWADRQSWIWQLKPALALDSVRVFLMNDLRTQRRKDENGSNSAINTRTIATNPSQ